MSKRKKNYPDPMHVINAYGSDALRLYLINSPVVRAENLRFQVCLRFVLFAFVFLFSSIQIRFLCFTEFTPFHFEKLQGNII